MQNTETYLPQPSLQRERERESYLAGLVPAALVYEVEKTGEKFQRTESIPLSRFVVEASIVDDAHADELGDAMIGPWGQTMPILTRCRIGGKTVNDTLNDILDGFHRTEGLRRKKTEPNPLVKTVVLYGCTDEEMFDQRILAANSVKSVKFARLGMWMENSWSLTPWRDKLTVAQACSIVSNDSSGKQIGISESELQEITSWVQLKSKKWLIPLNTLTANMRIIEMASPYLVSRVRTGSFSAGELSIAPTQLGIIAEAFPRQVEIQNGIAMFAHSHALSSVQLTNLVAEVKQLPHVTPQLVQEVIEQGNWRAKIISTSNDGTEGYNAPAESFTRRQALSTLGTLKRHVLYNRQLEEQGIQQEVLGRLDEVGNLMRGKRIDPAKPVAPAITSTPVPVPTPTLTPQPPPHITPTSPEKPDAKVKLLSSPAQYLDQITRMMRLETSGLSDRNKAALKGDFQKLLPDDITKIAKTCLDRIFLKDEKYRRLGDLVNLLPFTELSSEQATYILREMGGHIGRLKGYGHTQEEVGFLLTTISKVVDQTGVLQELSPQEWKLVISRMKDVSSRANKQTRKTIEEWAKEKLES